MNSRSHGETRGWLRAARSRLDPDDHLAPLGFFVHCLGEQSLVWTPSVHETYFRPMTEQQCVHRDEMSTCINRALEYGMRAMSEHDLSPNWQAMKLSTLLQLATMRISHRPEERELWWKRLNRLCRVHMGVKLRKADEILSPHLALGHALIHAEISMRATMLKEESTATIIEMPQQQVGT